jgi:hypothetical protein
MSDLRDGQYQAEVKRYVRGRVAEGETVCGS